MLQGYDTRTGLALGAAGAGSALEKNESRIAVGKVIESTFQKKTLG